MTSHDHHDEWQQLSARWQQSSVPAPDARILQQWQSRARRRDGWQRCVWLLEWGIALMAALTCLRALFDERVPVGAPVLIGLIIGVITFACWTHRQRRRLWRSRGLGPDAMLAFEQARARMSLRIWRASIWGALLVWCGLVLLAAEAMQAGPDAPGALPPSVWALNLLVNAAVVLASALAGAWLGQRRRRRLQRLGALREALDS